jgi:beta-phosphoglucomutase-like phosphatase (HAD superfamily)
MRAQVVILPGGDFALMIQEGSFEEAKDKIGDLLESLRQQGIEIASVSKVEQHRPDSHSVHLEDRTRVILK